MRANLDLHIHSKYSKATSNRMDLSTIAREAAKKGIRVVATGDCLHPRWIADVKGLREDKGLFSLEETFFVLTTEVEDSRRAHHLMLVPEISKVQELRETFSPHSKDIDSNGRPSLHMTAAEIADAAIEANCLIGPAHAFTPWTGMYAHYSSIQDCYGDLADQISFVELGLSADSDYADKISEIEDKTFLTNSDAHSPWSNKLGREFNQMEIKEPSFEELESAIRRKGGRKSTLNVGFYPEEGKYNRTACTRCYKHYTADEMDARRGRCECGGRIKLGVRDRVDILADRTQPEHPDYRPPYLHLIPLAEIIAMAIGHKSPYTAGVQKRWNELVKERTEIEVLLDADLSQMKIEPEVSKAIQAFRSGDVIVKPGGGGKYGEIELSDRIVRQKKETQKSLFDF